MERKVAGEESSERRATKSWVWARARAEERVPMCKIRFVCKSKELGGGGASGLVRVGGADGIFCPSLGGEGLRSGGDAELAYQRADIRHIPAHYSVPRRLMQSTNSTFIIYKTAVAMNMKARVTL